MRKREGMAGRRASRSPSSARAMVRSAVSNHHEQPGPPSGRSRSHDGWRQLNHGALKAPPPGGPNGPALTAPPTLSPKRPSQFNAPRQHFTRQSSSRKTSASRLKSLLTTNASSGTAFGDRGASDVGMPRAAVIGTLFEGLGWCGGLSAVSWALVREQFFWVVVGSYRRRLLRPCLGVHDPKLGAQLRVQRSPALSCAVDQEHVAGERVGPPPAEGGVDDEAGQHCGGQQPVDQGHPPFGA